MKFMDLHLGYEKRRDAIDKRIASIISRSQFIFGAELEELESELAKYVNAKYAIGVSSGADAIMLALIALGYEAGKDNSDKEIIVPSFTFFATAEAPAFLGMKPVFCDIDERTYNIDVNKIESLITKNTAVIMPVNIFGQCADLEKIEQIAKAHNLFVIEDACQSFGATFNNKYSCSFGDIAVTSFFPAKPLGCFGDGGMIFTDNEEYYNKIKMLRHHGDKGKMEHIMIGMTGRLDNLQAGILLEKFVGFDNDMDERIKKAQYYTENLQDVITTPYIESSNKSVYAQYCVQSKDKDKICKALNDKEIPTPVYYINPLHLAPVFKHMGYKEGDLPVSENLCKNIFALPIYPEIPQTDQDMVIDIIRNAVK